MTKIDRGTFHHIEQDMMIIARDIYYSCMQEASDEWNYKVIDIRSLINSIKKIDKYLQDLGLFTEEMIAKLEKELSEAKQKHREAMSAEPAYSEVFDMVFMMCCPDGIEISNE